MSNPRIRPKERGLIKGAIRRAFSRSELRKEVLEAGIVEHSDPTRPRVKTWVRCNICGKPEAKSNVEVDHILPVIPLDSSLEDMTWDELVDRVWCERIHLQIACHLCHDEKTRQEQKARRQFKKDKKNGKGR